MSNVDVPLQLHYALFKGCSGYVLKPPEMLGAPPTVIEAGSTRSSSDAYLNLSGIFTRAVRGTGLDEHSYDPELAYWPPPRKTLRCITLDLFSLHNLPKVCLKQACPPFYRAIFLPPHTALL